MYNGIINVYKEAGFTSHDVVAKLRGICRQKKIGHTGTLDPDAVGVLPVCFGSGTKLCDMLTDWDKEYIAVLRLGVVTDTQDMSGQVTAQASEEAMGSLREEEVRAVIAGFQGEYEQIPPMYSALKVNGKKLYELAREGREVERKARRVHIEEIEIQSVELPLVTMRVVCSKGTYIRTLCHDIGEKSGCGGAMESLVRSRVGIFRIEEAYTLSQLERLRDENRISDVIIKPDVIFGACKAVTVTQAGQKLVENGNTLGLSQVVCGFENSGETTAESAAGDGKRSGKTDFADKEQVRVYDSAGKFYGIYAYYIEDKIFKPVKMFL